MIRFENVGVRYGVGPEVLRDINLHIEPGSFYFLTGASGAGKSSLLKLMYLALHPSRGYMRLFGEDIARMHRRKLPELRRRIGVVFQDFRLLDHLNAFDNVALPLRIAGLAEAEIAAQVGELLEWVGLADALEASPATLSGGEKQRLAIARAVVARPELLLADEPTGNLDPELSLRLFHLFEELNKIGTTVLIATHSSELVEKFKHPALFLAEGRLVMRPENTLRAS